MKNSILAFSLALLVTGLSESLAKTGELKNNTSQSISHEEELELLEEYLPIEKSYEENNYSTVQVYNPTGELMIEGTIRHGEEINNPELRRLIGQSEFLMKVNEISLYRLEQ